MIFEVTILGSNSAIPAYGRLPTSQVINIRDKLYLADCGEGTQIQLQKHNIRKSRINEVFITHLHGDHFYGLVGLIASFHLLKRAKPLQIYGPEGLKEIIELQLKYSETTLKYELVFHQTAPVSGEVVFENEDITVMTLNMKHRIPCTGFLFAEKTKARKINPEKTTEFDVPLSFMSQLKNGKDYVDKSGKVIKNDLLTLPPPPPRNYAFCTDTAYNEDILQYIDGADLLYHEATFGQESAERAEETHHSTAKQAALIAKKGNVGQLILGHFSAKYVDLSPLLEEAREVFGNTELALEGDKFEIPLQRVVEQE